MYCIPYTQVNMVEFGARHFSHEMNKRKGKENIHARALACCMKFLLRSFRFVYMYFVCTMLRSPLRGSAIRITKGSHYAADTMAELVVFEPLPYVHVYLEAD